MNPEEKKVLIEALELRLGQAKNKEVLYGYQCPICKVVSLQDCNDRKCFVDAKCNNYRELVSKTNNQKKRDELIKWLERELKKAKQP